MSQVSMEHIGLSVSDLEASIAWYQVCFGFEVIKRFEKEEMEIKGALIRSGNCQIELLEPQKKDLAVNDRSTLAHALRRTGSNHFAISVESVSACFETMKSTEVELVTELIENRFYFCCDRDGTLIEVRQRPPSEE